VGVKGIFVGSGKIRSIGITCALCDSTVGNSLAFGIDAGWMVGLTDLNVGIFISKNHLVGGEVVRFHYQAAPKILRRKFHLVRCNVAYDSLLRNTRFQTAIGNVFFSFK